MHMRGTAALLLAKEKFNFFNSIKEKWGAMAYSMPKKQTDNDVMDKQIVEKVDPIVAFSKPPPLPPVIGPVVLLSLLEAYSSRDSNDD